MSEQQFEVWPGVGYPLGATWDGKGVNFAVYSENAKQVHVCLFDAKDTNKELARFELADQTNHVFHGYVPNLAPGALYNFRATGPWDPAQGLRFNPAKLLVDPYARALHGKPDWKAPLVGHVLKDEKELPDPRDSVAGVPRCIVLADDFDWSGDVRPEVIWRKAVVYEVHVKQFTARHPGVPPELRGTYAGLAHPASIEHFKKLGVTSLELLPVHECSPEGFLLEKGLTNAWGYNTLGFFAPDQRYAFSGTRGEQVREFKGMVKLLHQAGLEVILDVVYNHSCEGNHQGPTLAFRGLDNTTYYWLEDHDQAKYRDFTGCGNSLDASHPQVVKLIMDSLRYWVTEMHVDGFRFDLATTLARTHHGEFSRRSEFLAAIYQDPVLSRVKLIAEPWDLGTEGYRLGNFPLLFSEWNDRYRNTVRRFWRGDSGQLADLGYRLTGSSDFFKLSGRRPSASVNYVTAHDGFTLADLVSHSHKHNETNKEENRDGSNENYSANWGAEGETDDPIVEPMRERMQRNFIATLFLSQGTPMLLMGDELGRSQKGNNNAYCHDDELTYVDWKLDAKKQALLDFTRRCIELRAANRVLQRRNFFLGTMLEDRPFRDLAWFHPTGRELDNSDWSNPEQRCVGMLLGGDLGTRDPQGRRHRSDTLLVYFNAEGTALEVKLPPEAWGDFWDVVLETAHATSRTLALHAAETLSLPARSLMVLRMRLKAG